jgi:hypothetical protein
MPTAETLSPFQERYQQEQLARFQERIQRAKSELGEIYTGENRVSDKEYAKISRRFLKESAIQLFEMQIFPLVRIQEKFDIKRPHDQKLTVANLLEFKNSSGHNLLLDFDGNLLTQNGSTSIVDDESPIDAHLSWDMINPIQDKMYRFFATDALDALNKYASSNIDNIMPMRPVFSGGDLVEFKDPRLELQESV